MLDVNELCDRIQALRAAGCDSPLMTTAVSALEQYNGTLDRGWLESADSYIVAMESATFAFKGTAVVAATGVEVDAGKWRTFAEIRDATKAALAEAQRAGDAYAFVERITFHGGTRVGYDLMPVYAD